MVGHAGTTRTNTHRTTRRVVLYVLCMLIWPWPDPRSRSRWLGDDRQLPSLVLISRPCVKVLVLSWSQGKGLGSRPRPRPRPDSLARLYLLT